MIREPSIAATVDALLALGEPADPADSADLDALARAVGAPLPAIARAVWERADGIVVPGLGRWLSVDEADDYARALRRWGLHVLAPVCVFGPEHDPDPVALVGAGPLAGYLLRIAHDDDPLLLGRHVDDLVTVLRSGSYDALDRWTRRRWALGPLSADERAQGRSLLERPRGDDDTLVALAAQLLDDDDLPLLAPLLRDEDRYVRQSAADRIGVLLSAEAADVLAAWHADARRVAARTAELLRARGHEAVVDGEALRVEPGPQHLDPTAGFFRGDVEAAAAWLASRVDPRPPPAAPAPRSWWQRLLGRRG